MPLSRRAAGFLLGVSAWTAFIWITLVKNIAKDHEPGHGTGFHVVHYVLAAICLALTAIQARIAWTALPRNREAEDVRPDGKEELV